MLKKRQRGPLSYVERAKVVHAVRVHGLTQAQAGDLIGASVAAVARVLKRVRDEEARASGAAAASAVLLDPPPPKRAPRLTAAEAAKLLGVFDPVLPSAAGDAAAGTDA